MGLAGGVVSAEAKEAFERAVALDPRDVRARFYVGLAAEQDGRSKEAAEAWRALLADAPPDAEWTGFVRQSLARVDPAAASQPGPARGRCRSERNVAGTAQRHDPRHGGAAGGTAQAGRVRRRGLATPYSRLSGAGRWGAGTHGHGRRSPCAGGRFDKLRRVNEFIALELPPPGNPAVAADTATAPGARAERRRRCGGERNVARTAQYDGAGHGGAAGGTAQAGWFRRRGMAAVAARLYGAGRQGSGRAAAGDARRALASDPDKLRRVDEFVKGLGLEG